jgi:hypothetical protein
VKLKDVKKQELIYKKNHDKKPFIFNRFLGMHELGDEANGGWLEMHDCWVCYDD